MKLFYITLAISAMLHYSNATQNNNRRIVEEQRHRGENPAEPTFNIIDEDNESSNSGGDKVPLLIQYASARGGSTTAVEMDLEVTMHMRSEGILAAYATNETREALEKDPNIVAVEYDHSVHVLEEVPIGNLRRKLNENTPYGIPMVLQDMDFWSKLGDPTGTIKVCVADTGYDLGHEDTPKGDDITGTDNPEYPNDKWDQDPHGHGTHCSGTISALGGNDNGVVGVIPNNAGGHFQLVIANALTGSGSGSQSGVLAAVDNCVADGAKIVSLSLGGYYYSKISEDFYKKKYEEEGILFIAAAGNGGNSKFLYPAGFPSLMSVAAIDSNKNKASFSTFNDQVEISAPGVLIESSLPGNRYAKWSGTSMATPHVAGVAGLLWMYFPECKNYQIRNAILATAEDLRADGCDIETGFGVVRAKSAYELLAKGNCGGNLGVTDGTVGGCDQINPAAPTSAPNPAPSGSPSSSPTSSPTKFPTGSPSAPPKTCAEVKRPCSTNSDCCSNSCHWKKMWCLKTRFPTGSPGAPPKTCAKIKRSCATNSDCCSNRCHWKKMWCIKPRK